MAAGLLCIQMTGQTASLGLLPESMEKKTSQRKEYAELRLYAATGSGGDGDEHTLQFFN